jgi:hypothetical protein
MPVVEMRNELFDARSCSDTRLVQATTAAYLPYEPVLIFIGDEPQRIGLDDPDFLREESAFYRLLQDLYPAYEGRYVAIHEGIVVDADASSSVLARRFYNTYGDDAPVYIGYVGRELPSLRATPFPSR